MSSPPAKPVSSTAPGRAGNGGSVFMESMFESGQPRPHWQPLLESLERLGPRELASRLENGRRILREHGVSCFVNRNGRNIDEPWRLDLLPLMISAAEWRELESGITQRARLLNLILGDLHRAQRLVRDGFVPAPLLYANPDYLRACQAIQPPGGAYLHTYAVDLGRSPDGRWWVLADRTQTPPGIGFMLENRTVISRILPEAIESVRPRSLSEAVRLRRDTLRKLAQRPNENPTIVLLSPGQRSEAYFEHVYLSRLLSFTLVEGEDLTVRDRKVLVKTLEGLRPVDVILRRVSDAFCDPLELRADSLLGVPGLVEAARAGGVAVVNALGSGLLESPAFLPFLPSLCQQLLGEELKLPSVATWWCGQGRELNYVREHFEELAIRPAFLLGAKPLRPRELPSAERSALLEQVLSRAHEFVGQEEVHLSHAPAWSGQQNESRPFVLRLFVLSDGRNFQLMPGGLARIVTDESLGTTALSLSGLSKDVWVMPEADEGAPPMELAPAPAALETSASELPSRTADNFFWLGRYAERLEHVVRTARCVVGRLSDDTGAGNRKRIGALAGLLARIDLARALEEMSGREILQDEILAVLHQEDHPSGVRQLLGRIHSSAFSVRSRLSADTWRVLNRLEPDARPGAGRLPLVHAASMLNTLVLDLAAFSGMEMENMTRGHGWIFLDLGRRIERAANLARLLKGVLTGGEQTALLLEPALEIADSVMTYRRRYFSEANVRGMMELLVTERANPRSIAFQLQCIDEHAARLPKGGQEEAVDVLRRRIAQNVSDLGAFDAFPLGNVPAEEAVGLLDRLLAEMSGVTELLTQVFFSHVRPQVN